MPSPPQAMSITIRAPITEIVTKDGRFSGLRCDVPVGKLDKDFLANYLRALAGPDGQLPRELQLTHVSVWIDKKKLSGPFLEQMPKVGGVVDLSYVVTTSPGDRWFANKGTIVHPGPLLETSSGSKASVKTF